METIKKLKSDELYILAYKFIVENNKSNEKPYHNIYHSMSVFDECYKMANYYKLTEQEKKEICLAGLFHDFNHKGAKTDRENIDESLKGLRTFLSKNSKNISDSILSLDKAEEIILATEFPHKDIELTIQKKIIRDADITASIGDSWFMMTIVGLGEEFSTPIKQQIKNQIKFLSDYKFYTDYAKDNHKDNMKIIINDLKDLDEFSK